MFVLPKSCGRAQEEKWELRLALPVLLVPCWAEDGFNLSQQVLGYWLWGVVKHSAFGVLSLAGLGNDGEIILCQAALPCTRLCGLHSALREERVVAWGLEFVSKP